MHWPLAALAAFLAFRGAGDVIRLRRRRADFAEGILYACLWSVAAYVVYLDWVR